MHMPPLMPRESKHRSKSTSIRPERLRQSTAVGCQRHNLSHQATRTTALRVHSQPLVQQLEWLQNWQNNLLNRTNCNPFPVQHKPRYNFVQQRPMTLKRRNEHKGSKSSSTAFPLDSKQSCPRTCGSGPRHVAVNAGEFNRNRLGFDRYEKLDV